jgi:glycine cleavage system H protein
MKKEIVLYASTDEWFDPKNGEIGISSYATSHLGDLVFLDITASIGQNISKGETFGAVESVKAASDLYSPVSGIVIELNKKVLDDITLLGDNPWDSWLIKISTNEELIQEANLMTVDEYENSK